MGGSPMFPLRSWRQVPAGHRSFAIRAQQVGRTCWVHPLTPGINDHQCILKGSKLGSLETHLGHLWQLHSKQSAIDLASDLCKTRNAIRLAWLSNTALASLSWEDTTYVASQFSGNTVHTVNQLTTSQIYMNVYIYIERERVCVCMCIYVYLCMHVYIYIYYTYTYAMICVHVCMCISLQIHTHTYI